ncbi:MAG TPA: AraC family transcriptional regulator [Tepidisphaeraceae bacterium]|nr:AraC family transcriptional regulator [Tepidisphaeraceae bacterium]
MSSTAELVGHVTSGIFPDEHTPLMAQTWLHEGDDITHDHTFVEMAVVLKGTAVHRTIYGDQRIGAGDAFVVVPGAWHAYVQSRHLLVYNLLLGIELLQRELAWTREDPLMNYLLWTGPAETERRGIMRLALSRPMLRRARTLLDAVGQSTQAAASSNRAEQIGRLLLFLSAMAQQLDRRDVAVRKAPQQHDAVVRGVRLLENDLAKCWTLSTLSEQLDIDDSYLVRLFKRSTGLSPIAYLARARAERAAVMLLRTDLPIADIAADVGWHDPNYFARRFKSHFKIAATEYRRHFAHGTG